MPPPARSASHPPAEALDAAALSRHRRLVLIAIVLAAVNLRTAVTSVGPVLEEVRSGLGLSGAVAGLLTTLPVICFAVLGTATATLSRRFGEVRTLTGALVLMVLGVLLRAVANDVPLFLACSLLALVGGAIGNVVLPTLVKHHFPTRVGPLTAAYTTALAVGTTVAAAATVPVAELGGADGWRLGLGVWALPVVVALVPWIILLRDVRAGSAPAGPQDVHYDDEEAPSGVLALARRPMAWAMAAYFGSQALQAYVAFGWFAQFFREAGMSQARAGYLIAFLAALSIPISMVVPSVAARLRNQRPVVVALWACYVVGYVGMIVAPLGGAWAWAFLVGVGGGAFPLALTMIGLRSATARETAALSAFAQGAGYLVAGTGPLLVGALRSATGGWTWPFVILFVALVVQIVSGWVVGGERHAPAHATR